MQNKNSIHTTIITHFQNLDSAEKLGYVADLRQAIMFVRSDLKGKEILPGVCLPKKVIIVLNQYLVSFV